MRHSLLCPICAAIIRFRAFGLETWRSLPHIEKVTASSLTSRALDRSDFFL